MPRKNSAYAQGRWAEQIALDHLLKRKLKLLERNFRSAHGEVDLIMRDDDVIVFIEVRYRANNHFHTALESIDRKKCERIIATGHFYLTEKQRRSQQNYRFDVVALSGTPENIEIDWIKNAFQ